MGQGLQDLGAPAFEKTLYGPVRKRHLSARRFLVVTVHVAQGAGSMGCEPDVRENR